MTDKYQEFQLVQYGQQIEAYNNVYTDYAKNILEWMEHYEERQRKRQEWYASPEGQAHLKSEREKELKRAKFQKHWQKLHDWLAENGCECDHDGCY